MRGRVLLVDDSEVVLEIAGAALSAAGFSVVTAPSALGLGSLMRTERPDCIVLDVCMPLVPGNRSASMMRELGGVKTPILLHSDRPLEELRRLAAECGANGVVPKSADCQELVEAVGAAIEAAGRTE